MGNACSSPVRSRSVEQDAPGCCAIGLYKTLILTRMQLQRFKYGTTNTLAKLWGLIAVQLDNVQPDLISNIIDVVSLCIDKNTNQFGGRLPALGADSKVRIFKQQRYLLRLDIAVARLIKHKAKHICPCTDGSIDMFVRA